MPRAGSPIRPALAILALIASGPAGLAQPASEPTSQGRPPVPVAPPVIGCQSLANLRILLRRADDEPAAAAAILAAERIEHVGCAVLARDKVTAVADHVALNGRAYDCVGLATTSVCHWVVAGSVALPEAAPVSRTAPPAPQKGRR